MPFLSPIRQRWEDLAPRERKLLNLLGLTAVVGVFLFVAVIVRSGLAELDAKNGAARAALRALDENRDDLLAKKGRTDVDLGLAQLSESLRTYTDNIAGEVGIQITESAEKPAVPRGKFQERSVDLKLRGVDLEQLGNFLRQIETRSPGVVTQRLYIKPYFNQHEKLDVEVTVAVYERAPKGSGKDKNGKGEKGDKPKVDGEEEGG